MSNGRIDNDLADRSPDIMDGTSQSSIQITRRKFQQVPQSHNKLLVTLVHLLCIASFAAFLTWGLQGKVPINGDDIRVTRRMALHRINYKYDYLKWTGYRYHVIGLLNGELQLAGNSIEKANLLWLSIYVASAFACYAYLRKVVTPSIAMSGAVFYLCYCSKFEPLTWWSAGGYTIIWLTFFLLMRLLESKLPFRTKAVAVTLVTWASLYIYEVFTVLIPLFSLLLLLRQKRKNGLLRKSDWLYASLPMIALTIHIATLASVSEPIYNLDPATVNKIPISERVAAGFSSALDATIGPKHNAIVKHASHSFRHFVLKEQPILRVLMWTSICLFIAGIAIGTTWTFAEAPSAVTVGEHALIGATALFVSAFIGFVSNFCVTPSRLTGIPSIGLMILMCTALEALLLIARRTTGWKKYAAVTTCTVGLVLVLLGTVREGQAFNSLLRQAGEVNDFDMRIARKIQALQPFASKGDEIYVRMPRAQSEVGGRWTNFWSGFNSGRANETLWYLYDVPPGDIIFNCSPYRCGGENDRMQQIVEGWSSRGIRTVAPFYVDDNGDAFAINRLDLTDSKGRVLKSLDFSSKFSHLPDTAKVSQSIPINSLPAQLR
ncbi:hypothetical protein BH10CYA1_BH10CYA1_38860 [soil metagenome]